MPPLLRRLVRVASRRFPFLTGRATLVQSPPLRWLHFREKRLTVRLADGSRLVVFPNDFIGKAVYFFGDLDPKIPRTLARLLDPGDTLIDVGANVGLVSVQCLRLVGPHGRVVAVEPQPLCCEALAETVALNDIRNLEVHCLALSDQAGRLKLTLPDAANLGTATLGSGPADVNDDSVVTVRNGGEFLESLQIQGDYVLKIDVEGHEDQVLAGFAPYFASRPPKGIVFESQAHVYEGKDFFRGGAYRQLRAGGFRVFQIPKSFVSLKYIEVRLGGAAPRATDFVAVRPDQVERLTKRRREPRPARSAP